MPVVHVMPEALPRSVKPTHRPHGGRLAGLPPLAVMAIGLLVLGGCGLANSFGVHHALYSEEAAFCHYCAAQDSVCDAFSVGGSCVAADSFADCDAAGVMSERDTDGPYVSPQGKAEFLLNPIDRCDAGLDEVDVELTVLDLDGDAAFRGSYDGTPDPFDLSKDIVFVLADGEEGALLEWVSAESVSADGDIVYRLRVAFCVANAAADHAAIQLRDERGHASNVICLSSEGGADDA